MVRTHIFLCLRLALFDMLKTKRPDRPDKEPAGCFAFLFSYTIAIKGLNSSNEKICI